MTAPAQSPRPVISVLSASPPASVPQTATTIADDPTKWLPTRPGSPPAGSLAASPIVKHPLPHISHPHSIVAKQPGASSAVPSARQPPRECLQWLRSLNLETPVTPTTLANGYLIAEIFSRYFPPHALAGRVPRANQRLPIDAIVRSHPTNAVAGMADVAEEGDVSNSKSLLARDGFPMHSFQNGCGSQSKSRNWAQLRKFLAGDWDWTYRQM
ncbi:hypothetical protein BCR44DRAFT_1280205 [Catenaria anguillulae PL171]|uniref:CH-like domain-containing protein n=1 Tax=Catenaria anguillulae PL171 TaxID=765915 RepID=A0A1Y2HAR1_9FUNG|nr:hypothetical protein BCR44DRAFT_1280205 [Catenaria anguillulae PL171]